MAKVRSGKLVNSPRELTSTPKPAAMSDKTVGSVVNGVRKTIPSIMMPGTNNIECVFFINPPQTKILFIITQIEYKLEY